MNSVHWIYSEVSMKSIEICYRSLYYGDVWWRLVMFGHLTMIEWPMEKFNRLHWYLIFNERIMDKLEYFFHILPVTQYVDSNIDFFVQEWAQINTDIRH